MNSLPNLNVSPTMDASFAVDRLSELPDPLIHEILSFLPMRDVVRSAVFSKRWGHLWTTVPYLHFHFDERKDSYNFPDVVKKVLARLKGGKILKFGIDFFKDDYDHNDVNSWFRFAVEKQVEELYVKLVCDDYPLPDAVYSCSSFRKLSLNFLQLGVKESVNWNRLNSLTIDGVYPFTEDVMNHILLGAPLLEVLILRTQLFCGDLNIRSTSLKMLHIYFYDIDTYPTDVEAPTIVTVSAPILEILEFAGIRFTRCLLKVLSLNNANLDFDVVLEVEPLVHIEVGGMFTDSVLDISHAVKLTLNKWSLMLLVDEWKDDNFLLFSNAKFLKLGALDAEGMLNVLEMFPKLEMLMVERDEHEEYDPKCDLAIPHPSLQNLKKVEITWCIEDDDSITPVIKTILKDAPELRDMVVRLGKDGAGAELDLYDLRHVDIFL